MTRGIGFYLNEDVEPLPRLVSEPRSPHSKLVTAVLFPDGTIQRWRTYQTLGTAVMQARRHVRRGRPAWIERGAMGWAALEKARGEKHG